MDRRQVIIVLLAGIIIFLSMPQFYAAETEKLNQETEEELEQPDKVWKCFEVSISEADSREGYYRIRPSVEIRHMDEAGRTYYILRQAETVVESGSIGQNEEVVNLKRTLLEDGIYTLQVYMTDDEDIPIGEQYQFAKTMKIDTLNPEIKVTAPRGFDAWYQHEVQLEINSKDDGSGINLVRYYLDDLLIREEKIQDSRVNSTFVVSLPSENGQKIPVKIEVWDQAGNHTQVERGVYVDQQYPQVSIKGVNHQEIISRDILLQLDIYDENGISEWQLRGSREQMDGTISYFELSDKQELELTGEGIYRLELQAIDPAGYSSSETLQVIIDKTDPLIRVIDELEGSYIREFRLNVSTEEMVEEFTSYDLNMTLNGQLYNSQETIYTEGIHLLKVQVKDAAGNTADAKARFTIDRTKPEIIFTDLGNGQHYAPGTAVRINLTEPDDEVSEVRINGKKVKVESSGYQYRFDDAGEYEITAIAQDKAGNVAKESVSFTITKQSGAAGKLMNPVQKFLGNQSAVNEVTGSEQGPEKFYIIWLACIGCIGGLVVFQSIRRRH